jgi:hypothetical protein
MSEIHDDLDRVGRQRRAANEARDAAAEATEQVIVRALKAAVRPADIAKRLDVTDSFVRKIRAAHNLPADPRYASVRPPTRQLVNETRDSVSGTATDVMDDIEFADTLTFAEAERAALMAVSVTEDGWAERVLAAHPGAPVKRHPYLLFAAALAEGHLKRSDITRDGE